MPMTPYLRYPHLHDDLIAFVAADDVWLVHLGGGPAWRLSDDGVPALNPRFSLGGRAVAWTARRDGAAEVYAAPTDGGPTTRLTWWGNPHSKVVGWTGEGDTAEVLVASPAGENHLRDHWLHAVGLSGASRRLPYGPASALAQHPGGAVVLCSAWSREPAHWKRYRGGTASQLWIDRDGSGEFVRLLPELTSGLAAPMWIGDRLVFVSDHEGVGNLYSVTQGGADLRRHTDNGPDDGYVRNPASDGERIVYHALGRAFLLESLGDTPREVPITLSGSVSGRRPRPLGAAENVAFIRPVADAAGSVVQQRGTVHYLTHREGPSRVLAAEPGVRVRDSAVLGSSGNAVWVTDAGGEDALEVRPLDASAPARRLAAGQLGRVLSLAASPDGSRVAVVSHDGRVLLVDTTSGGGSGDGPGRPGADDAPAADRLVDRLADSRTGEPEGLTFSPDGRWLAFSAPTAAGGYAQQLFLVDLAAEPGSRAAVTVTSGRFSDTCPRFTADGKYLAFLSARTFDPVYDAHVFDISFPVGTRPHLMPLAADTPLPFGPAVDGWPVTESKAAGDSDNGDDKGDPGGDGDEPAAGKPSSPPEVRIDLDGLAERAVALPVPAGRYRDLRAADGGLLFVSEPLAGVLGAGNALGLDKGPRPSLQRWDFAARKCTTIVEGLDSYEISAGGKHIVVRDGDTVTVRPAEKKADQDDPALITVDLARVRATLDPVAEWRQMYVEAGRLMRDHYWRADMNGVDWDAAVARYAPAVDRAASRDDIVDLLWESAAELGTSHAYANPPETPADDRRRQGLLGADVAVGPDGTWRITRILPGDSSDPDATSPLRAAGVAAKVGDAVLAVDGRPVGAAGPARLLEGAAGKPVELLLGRDGTEPRRVAVVPLADEERLRYNAWVADRRSYVDTAGGGRLGYLHVPDMMAPGWAQIHRDLRLAVDREGLIVDVRYNRGGHLSQLVIERLARKVIGWSLGRYRAPETYPDQAPRGPVVFVANQWSGSDGDIVNAVARILGVGPIVGVRTWGGVIGIDGRFSLVDGTSVTQPRYASWFTGVGWGVENHGVDPDIEVPMAPQDYAAGRDPQLDRAIAEALGRLAATPAAVPPQIPPLG